MGVGFQGVSLLLIFSVLFSTSIQANEFPLDGDCREFLAEMGDPSTPHREITFEAKRVLEEIKITCATPASCSTEQLQSAVESAIDHTSPKYRSHFTKLRLLSQRALVLLIWGGAILGPGVVSYYITSGMPEFIRYSVSNFVMVMSGVLFGNFSAPIQKKIGPMMEQMAFHIWSPDEDDSWGQIMKKIPETDRLRYSQIYNQLIVLRSYFEFAGHALKKGDFGEAAHHYVNAILNSYDMFAGLHLDNSATIREVRAFLPNVAQIDSKLKQSVIDEAVRIIEMLPDEELNENVLAHRSEVAHFAKKTISLWLKFP